MRTVDQRFDMATDTDSRPQFSLAALMGAVIACAVIFVSLANMEATYRVSIRCQAIPADDQGLAKWFEEQEGVQDVSTFRDGESVNVEFTKRHGSFELLAPPLTELGYAGLQSTKSTVWKPSIIGGTLIWVHSSWLPRLLRSS